MVAGIREKLAARRSDERIRGGADYMTDDDIRRYLAGIATTDEVDLLSTRTSFSKGTEDHRRAKMRETISEFLAVSGWSLDALVRDLLVQGYADDIATVRNWAAGTGPAPTRDRLSRVARRVQVLQTAYVAREQPDNGKPGI